jgi:Leucine Rich repeat
MTCDLPTPNAVVPRRPRRFVISLRSMMILVLVFGGWLGWFVRRVQVQHDAVAAVKNAGGSVFYDLESRNAGPNPYRNSWVPDWLGGDQAWIPKWMMSGAGIDYFGNVVEVNLIPSRTNDPMRADDGTLALVARLERLQGLRLTSSAVTDAGMAYLSGLTNLRDLQAGRTQIGDSGLAHIKSLTSLRSLYIADTPVSDAGLAHLRGLTNLSTLYLSGTKVTDDGVLALERALPQLQILREEDMSFSAALPRAFKDLDYVQSQPIRLACMLLSKRAEVMANRGEITELVATIDAICRIQPSDKVGLLKLAYACATCVRSVGGYRSRGLSDQDRMGLKQRCADKGIAALARAVDLGLEDLYRIDEPDHRLYRRNIRASQLEPLRAFPAFQALVDKLKEKHSER